MKKGVCQESFKIHHQLPRTSTHLLMLPVLKEVILTPEFLVNQPIQIGRVLSLKELIILKDIQIFLNVSKWIKVANLISKINNNEVGKDSKQSLKVGKQKKELEI